MLGRLSWDVIPFNEPLPLLSGAVVGIVILAVLVTVTVKGWRSRSAVRRDTYLRSTMTRCFRRTAQS